MALVKKRPKPDQGGLGDLTRLRILEHLVDGEKSVEEFVDLIGSSQGRIGRHLACLR
jgi:DNA-binding transcriptional ArsR family regulator